MLQKVILVCKFNSKSLKKILWLWTKKWGVRIGGLVLFYVYDKGTLMYRCCFHYYMLPCNVSRNSDSNAIKTFLVKFKKNCYFDQ
jgi:hypothetical protein